VNGTGRELGEGRQVVETLTVHQHLGVPRREKELARLPAIIATV
jgi:hypothetical protein